MEHYEMRPEDLITITTPTGLSCSRDPARGSGRSLWTGWTTMIGARAVIAHRDMGLGTRAITST